MSEALNTSLQTQLSTDVSGTLFWESDNKEAAFPLKYYRLYGDYTKKYNTSGSLTLVGTEDDDIDTYLTLINSRQVSLRHANHTGLIYSLTGSAYDIEGNIVYGVILTFNAIENAIESNKECIAVIHVKYTTEYDLFKFRFAGGPCPKVKPTEPKPSPYNTAVLIALNEPTANISTTTVTPPECPDPEEDENVATVRRKDAEQPALQLEVDPKRPPKARKSKVSGKLYADCDLKLYPDVNASMAVNLGTLSQSSGGNASGVEVIKETLDFSGSATSQLGYQPLNGVALEIKGDVTDQWGNKVSADVRAPGERVTVVEWTNAHTYKYEGSRNLGPDEIGIVVNNKLKPVFAVVIATYTTSFKRYRYEFNYIGDVNLETKVFDPGFIIAHLGEASATQRVDIEEDGSK